MHAVTSAIQSVPPLAAYAIFIGFVLPGETAVLLGGFLASTHDLNIWVLCVLVFISAVVGDTVGYEVGRLFGPRIVRSRIFAKHQARIDSAREMLRRRGGPAVFLGRFTAFLRAVMPGLAGLSVMQYRKFLIWNALGGLCWGVTFSLVGYFAGASYETVASRIGTGAAITFGVLVVGGLAALHIRRKRRERAEQDEYDARHAVSTRSSSGE